MIKGYRIRIYPTKEQEQLIWKHIGACRFIWNYMLELQNTRNKNGEKYLHTFDMNRLLTPLKKHEEYLWLNEISNTSLQRTCTELNDAFISFFENKTGFPKFKSRKRSKPNYPVCCNRFYFNDTMVYIQKIGQIKYKTDFNLPKGKGYKFSNVRISHINNKFILSFGLECENQASSVLTDKRMGIDLGIKDLAVVAYENEKYVFYNINKTKRVIFLKRKLKHIQRLISKKYIIIKEKTGKYEKTKNIVKLENKVKRINEQLHGIRFNYVHQTTHKLVSMLPNKVTMETLCVTAMGKNKHMREMIQEQCFYEFTCQMRYKCKNNGIEFAQAPRFYPSSKTCSNCGNIKHNLRLCDRVYICDKCGLEIDRDYNAALNLMKYTDLH